MTFSWQAFVEQRRIDYVTQGASTARGNIYVRCPWCDGDNRRMGLSLSSSVYGCWKDPSHRGRNPVRLVAALLRCSTREAQAACEQGAPVPGSWDELRATLSPASSPELSAPQYRLPGDLRKLERGQFRSEPFFEYLRKRDLGDVDELVQRYDVRYALTGEFAYRVVFPITVGGVLRAATGRSIADAVPKYLTLPHGKETGQLLFNEDLCPGGNTLLVVEGPLDAVALDMRAQDAQAHVCAILGASPSRARVARLRALCARYARTYVLLDADALAPAWQLSDKLINSRVLTLPDGVKDPGSMDSQQISAFLGNL